MINSSNRKICVIGIGNTLRKDDGIAQFVCDKLKENFDGKIEIVVTQQLDIGWAEKIKNFNTVFFVDASVYDEFFFIKKIEGKELLQTTSHHLNVAALIEFTKKIYHTKTDYYLCGIKGYDFDFGFELSEDAKFYALKVIDLLHEKIEKLMLC